MNENILRLILLYRAGFTNNVFLYFIMKDMAIKGKNDSYFETLQIKLTLIANFSLRLLIIGYLFLSCKCECLIL